MLRSKHKPITSVLLQGEDFCLSGNQGGHDLNNHPCVDDEGVYENEWL